MGIYVKFIVVMGLLVDIISGINIIDCWIINKFVFRKR